MANTEDPRWNVELADGDSHDVGATQCHITHGGTLTFYDIDGNLLVAYAPHRWSTVNAQ
jgi:hypothetical protein